MREIKFRGRKINTNKWIVGNLGYTKTSGGNSGILVEGKLHIVDSETVGQYTGLKDKNGKEIYEDDILTASEELPLYIEFSKEYSAFCFVDMFDPHGRCLYTTKDLHWEDDLEVAGNIHDNPELLDV
ncbi:YopX family protein [Bacillus cereus]|nr:YopX family protein [Bacillus cereus]MDA2497829.1 YopX family protein [Bacillus cereus]